MKILCVGLSLGSGERAAGRNGAEPQFSKVVDLQCWVITGLECLTTSVMRDEGYQGERSGVDIWVWGEQREERLSCRGDTQAQGTEGHG